MESESTRRPGYRPVFALLVIGTLVCGCKVGPEYEPPEVSVAEGWTDTEDPRIQSESTDHGDWWASFEDSTLTELIELAHAENLPLRVAGIRIIEARAELGKAVGNLYPQKQGAFGSYSRVKVSGAANPVPISGLPFSNGIDDSFNNYQVGLGAVWELDLWGKVRNGIQAADAQYIATVASYDDLLVSLTAEVAITFVTIRTLEERLTLARKNLELQENSLEMAESRFQNGVTSELDPSQARSLVATTRGLIPVLEIALRQARNGLAILLGRRSDQIAEILDGPGTIPTAPTSVAVGIPGDLLRRRPDIRLAELQAIAQCSAIGIAKADLLPKFGIGGAFGWSAANSSDLFDSNSDTGFFGPYFAWDILNYGRITNNVRAQDAKFQALLVNYQDTVLRAQREVEDSLAGFLGHQEEVAALTDAVTAAERSVELAMDQYRQGSAPYTRVLDTQQFLTRQQDLLTRSRGSVCTNLIGVYRSLGGGWQIRQGRDFVPAETKQEMEDRTNWGKLLEKAEDVERDQEPKASVRLPDAL
jgi:NodT family efflux transporter outer membrane factor (OMF) lipoprotein